MSADVPRRPVILDDLLVRAELELRRAGIPVRLSASPALGRLHECAVDATISDDFAASVVREDGKWWGFGSDLPGVPPRKLLPGVDGDTGPIGLGAALLRRLYDTAEDAYGARFVEHLNDPEASDEDWAAVEALRERSDNLRSEIKQVLETWAENPDYIIAPTAGGLAAYYVLVDIWIRESEAQQVAELHAPERDVLD